MARSPLRAFVLIFALSFAIRGALLFSGWLRPGYFRPFGEIGRVAVSLARSGRFADPYKIPTGLTAHPTPIYAGVLGLIYRVFGVTVTAAYVRGLLAIVSFSALYAMLPWLALRLGLGASAGVLGGLAGALIPQQGILEIVGGSDNLFPGIALGLLAVAFLSRWSGGRDSILRSLLLGIGCGVALHLSPPLLLLLLGWVAFEMVWRRDRRKWLFLACLALGAIAACIPWAWRNYTAFHEFLFIRSNFGLELRLANHDGADADIDVTVAREPDFRHPSASLEEARKVRDLGEAEYMRQSKNEALDWISRHPRQFLLLTMRRAVYFWCGPLKRLPWTAAAITMVTIVALLGLRHILRALPSPQRAALLIPLATFPLVYYVVSFVGHYRAPIEWMLLLLAGAEVCHWIKPKEVEA
jgi:4-amino-4-deoxy-L-arabinose transferase-like glycosyltransferase